MTSKFFSILAGGALVLGAVQVQAAPTIFFGEDFGLGETTPLTEWPNATSAEAAFLSSLSGVGTENFESYSSGTGAPLDLTFPGAGLATLSGSGSIASVPVGSTNGVGRYATSGTSYWDAANVFSITFTEEIAAFGFYGTDIGDFNGQVTVTTDNGDVFNIGNSVNIAGGSVLFWGIIDVENPFTSLTFGNTSGGTDIFGFDDMTIGTVEQVTPPVTRVPEPATLALLGLGLLGLGTTYRRKHV